jgi:hypothetical protein
MRHPSPHRRRLTVTLMFAVYVFMGPAASGALASEPVAEPAAVTIEQARAERETFGLRADREFVADLLLSSSEVGMAHWGIPMTAEEEQELDLLGRMSFAQEAHDRVLPFAASLPSYAGAYFDQREGGKLVILLTGADPAAEESLRGLAPRSRSVEINYRSHAYADLVTASRRAWSAWTATTEAAILSVAVNDRDNRLDIATSDARAADSAEIEARLVDMLRVDVVVAQEDPSADEACTSRTNCIDPMRSGIQVYHSKSATTIQTCTMGFHVKNPSTGALQFVTAGHCVHTGGSSWYHQGYGSTSIGSTKASQLVSPGRDIARVGLPNSQVSNRVYGTSARVEGSGNPQQGEAICASLGVTSTFDCGTVQDTNFTWTSNTCNCTVTGARHQGIVTNDGDSGSPIVRLNSTTIAIGIGIHNNANGGFAKLQQSLNYWGWQAYIGN